jgi:hypothetical protein
LVLSSISFWQCRKSSAKQGLGARRGTEASDTTGDFAGGCVYFMGPIEEADGLLQGCVESLGGRDGRIQLPVMEA